MPWAIALAGMLIGLYAMGPSAFSKTVYHDDTASIPYWAFIYQEGNTFAQDDLCAHFRRVTADPVPKVLYAMTAPWFDPLWMPTVFGALASAMAALFGYLFGLSLISKENENKFAAIGFSFAAVAVIWYGGLPLSGVGNGGDFLVPLILAALWATDRKNPVAIFVILTLAAFTYPTALVICAAVAAMASVAGDGFRPVLHWKIVLAVVVPCCLFFTFRAGMTDSAIGVLRSASAMVMDPEFSQWGRHAVFWDRLWMGLLIGHQGGIMIDPQKLMLTLFIIGLLIARRSRFGQVHPSLRFLILGSLFWFVTAWGFLAKLYYPSRYLRGALTLFLAGVLITALTRWIIGIQNRRWKIIAQAISILLVLVALAPFIGGYNYRESHQPKLYESISKLPATAMIAGHPSMVDTVPLFSKRSVLTSFENLMPVFDQYAKAQKKRTFALFDALYSDSTEKILDFCNEYRVTHLLIHPSIYEQRNIKSRFFYPAPYWRFALSRWQINQGRMVLDRSHFPGELYNEGQGALVPCTTEALSWHPVSHDFSE